MTLEQATAVQAVEQTVRERGFCKWFNGTFGFIQRDSDGQPLPDAFVHFTSIQMDGFKSLREGQAVEFDVVKTAKGLAAAKVTPVTN